MIFIIFYLRFMLYSLDMFLKTFADILYALWNRNILGA